MTRKPRKSASEQKPRSEFKPMGAAEFNAICKRLNITPNRLAHVIGISPSLAYKHARDEQPVSKIVAKFMRVLSRYAIDLDEV